MKNQLKWILPVMGFIVLLLAAGGIYRQLSTRYTPQTTAPSVSSTAAASEVNEAQAIDFTVQDDNGAQISLSDLRGKPVVLNFWATWCPYCVQELPAFEEAADNYSDRVNFMMIDLTDGYRETVDAAKAYISESGYTFPVYYDVLGEASQTFSITSVPLTVFLHPDGTVMDTHLGAMQPEMLQTYLDRLVA